MAGRFSPPAPQRGQQNQCYGITAIITITIAIITIIILMVIGTSVAEGITIVTVITTTVIAEGSGSNPIYTLHTPSRTLLNPTP